jgi:predicted secreted hydrolase
MRRRLVLAPLLAGCWPLAHALPPAQLRFPRDAGSHNNFNTEWWYATGYTELAGRKGPRLLGFQVTFFRSRVAATQGMRSRLAARHLLFAHAAVTDVQGGKLWHDQRIARWSGEPAGRNPADVAHASTEDTAVAIRDWHLVRKGADLHARIRAADFALDLALKATQPVLLQGVDGLSRKGPQDRQASYYYSLPQLQVSGSVTLPGETLALPPGGRAWLDHEWSQEVLHPEAVGWDWVGMNLRDGSALTAFRLRTAQDSTLWDGGSFRTAQGLRTAFKAGEVHFEALRRWSSPSSRASYPVEWRVRTPAGAFTVHALLDNQELDSRNSTGAIYWEGLCELRDSTGRAVGRGYLEMTGYAGRLQM